MLFGIASLLLARGFFGIVFYIQEGNRIELE